MNIKLSPQLISKILKIGKTQTQGKTNSPIHFIELWVSNPNRGDVEELLNTVVEFAPSLRDSSAEVSRPTNITINVRENEVELSSVSGGRNCWKLQLTKKGNDFYVIPDTLLMSDDSLNESVIRQKIKIEENKFNIMIGQMMKESIERGHFEVVKTLSAKLK